MVVVDSSVLIPLSKTGDLELIQAIFSDVYILDSVKDEILVKGKKGTGSIKSFIEDYSSKIKIKQTPNKSEKIADLEGITTTDAGVILFAKKQNDVLLANDKALIEIAKTHNIDCWWLTTLLLKCRKEKIVTTQEARNILYNLVDKGINLDPKVYSEIQKKLEEIE